jgi:hypothetical protein
MSRILTLMFFVLVGLFAISSHAQSSNYESEDMSEFARPRPGGQRTVYRCCAKPYAVYGSMNCRESTDRLLAWSLAINSCENKYGNGNCVSGCRRLFR